MLIQDQKKIAEIQKEFNDKFPYLKIKFYYKKHETFEGSAGEEISQDLKIGDVRTIHNEGDMSINGHQKVGNFEKNFAEKYGLNVQVFRRSDNLWLQTTSTDTWTLTEQNNHGKESMNVSS